MVEKHIRYVFKEVAPIRNVANIDVQVLGEEIEAIRKQVGDEDSQRVHDALWQAAQNPRHHLHGSYEWDIKKAAQEHWRDTSRRIINCIRIVDVNAPEGNAPAFVSIKSEKGGYELKSLPEVKGSGYLQERLLDQAMRDLQAWKNRYQCFSDVFENIDRASDTLERKKKKNKPKGDEDGKRPT